MGLTCDELLDVIQRSDRAYQLIRGYVAEWHLEKHLGDLKRAGRIDDFRYINQEGKPDFEVRVGSRSSTVECKNVRRGKPYRNGDFKVDFQRTRNTLEGGLQRFYRVADFDVLAACLYNQTRNWKFVFIETARLPVRVVNGVPCIEKNVHVPPNLKQTGWVASLPDLFRKRARRRSVPPS